MPLSIIDGSNANIDFTAATNSYKGHFGYWSADIVRDMFEKTTFASGGWRERTPGMKQLIGRADGYLAKGDPQSDPSTLVTASTAGVAFVLTADTGCTFTFTGNVTRSHAGLRAAANSEHSIDFESTGSVTIAWVVA